MEAAAGVLAAVAMVAGTPETVVLGAESQAVAGREMAAAG